MRKLSLVPALVLMGAMVSFSALAQNTPDGDAVVEAVKAKNPDMRSLCQKGPDGIRAAVMEAIGGLMAQGKLQGNPQAAGGEAGGRLGRECRG